MSAIVVQMDKCLCIRAEDSPLPQDADPTPVNLDPAEEHQQYVKAFFDKFNEPSVDKAIDQFDHDTRTDLLSLITNASETNFADPKWFPAIVDFLSQHGITLDVSDLPEHFYKSIYSYYSILLVANYR